MNMAMLPRSYFPPEAAVKILFIGKALQILRRRYGPTMAVQDPGALSDAARQFRQHQALFGQFFVALKSRPRFNVYVLGKAIEKIRRIVAKHLWRVVVSDFLFLALPANASDSSVAALAGARGRVVATTAVIERLVSHGQGTLFPGLCLTFIY